jgi:hypothetical protein
VVRTILRVLEKPGRSGQTTGRWGPGQRITGYARS